LRKGAKLAKKVGILAKLFGSFFTSQWFVFLCGVRETNLIYAGRNPRSSELGQSRKISE
jgi:hypothetical protein